MSSTEETTLENVENAENVENVEHVEPKKKIKTYHKIRTAPHRHLPDGTYDHKPNSPTYWNDYYNSHKQPTECPHCHRMFTHKQGLRKHYLRCEKCKQIRGELTKKDMSSLKSLATALALISSISEFEKLD
jgi:hypothetical protein